VERVKAGQEPKKKQLYKREREGLYIRKKIGCSLSHMRVLLQSLVHGWPLTMVLEDDAELSPDFFPQLQQVLCKLPRDWDVLFLVSESLPPVNEILANLGAHFTPRSPAEPWGLHLNPAGWC